MHVRLTPVVEGLSFVSMQAASLEVLEKANVPAPQARAIVQAIEIELAGAKDTLATKHDLLLAQHALEVKIEGLRADMRVELHGGLSGVSRQMYAAMLGQMAVLLGVAYFFITHAVH